MRRNDDPVLSPYVLGKEMHETKEGYIAKEEEGCDS
jgi:hypothetical protein